MLAKVLSFISQNNLFQPKEPVLLAISGGVDSTVLAHLLKAARCSFALAHINFRLRGSDSDADAGFVQKLAAGLDVPFFLTSFDTQKIAADNKLSIQMAARDLRYEWLEQTRKLQGYHWIVTAHHRDDQIETVLLNMFRGTGIHGLHGIRPKQGKVVRPMLTCSKMEILSFASSKNIAFREDVSNKKTDYNRNKIRLEIIPAIEKHYPAFGSTFLQNITQWKDAGDLYDAQISLHKKKLLSAGIHESAISIPKLLLLPASQTILYELLKDYGFSGEQSASVHASLSSQPGKVFFSATHRILKDRNELIITGIEQVQFSSALINAQDTSAKTASFQLTFSMYAAGDFTVPSDHRISCLNYDHLQFPLLLRQWRTGDYFYPLGMKNKKKKISDYLIDNKIPMHKKEQVWVLQSGDRIACIIGERIDERFKVSPSTRQVWVIKMET